MQSKSREYRVTLERPPGMTDAQVAHIIQRAICAEVGHCQPEEPFFELDRETVKVTPHVRRYPRLR